MSTHSAMPKVWASECCYHCGRLLTHIPSSSVVQLQLVGGMMFSYSPFHGAARGERFRGRGAVPIGQAVAEAFIGICPKSQRTCLPCLFPVARAFQASALPRVRVSLWIGSRPRLARQS